MFKLHKSSKVALCLGGGGARGFAHIGALKAFEEAGIKFDMVSGTSVGALVGAFYAAGFKSGDMEAFGAAINPKEIHSGFRPNDPKKVGEVIKKHLGELKIENLGIKYYAVATDLRSAREVIIDKGYLHEAVSASCAVPMFFRPLVMGGRHLADGGLLNNIPADICRMMGADFVVTVDINSQRGTGTDSLGVIDVVKTALSIALANASTQGLINSDIIIAPDLSAFSARKKTGHGEMMRLGYEAAKEKIGAIYELFGIKAKTGDDVMSEKELKKAEKRRIKEEDKAKKRRGRSE